MIGGFVHTHRLPDSPGRRPIKRAEYPDVPTNSSSIYIYILLPDDDDDDDKDLITLEGKSLGCLFVFTYLRREPDHRLISMRLGHPLSHAEVGATRKEGRLCVFLCLLSGALWYE